MRVRPAHDYDFVMIISDRSNFETRAAIDNREHSVDNPKIPFEIMKYDRSMETFFSVLFGSFFINISGRSEEHLANIDYIVYSSDSNFLLH